MLYNLRIGKSRYPAKNVLQCVDIISARRNDITKDCRVSVDAILRDVCYMAGQYRRLAYYGNDGKIFLSINRKKGGK